MPRPKSGLLLQPLVGSDRGFVFSQARPFAAYVLDGWSFTILQALGELPEADVLRTLLLHADSSRPMDAITADFHATLSHLSSLGLLEQDHAQHS